MGVGGARGEEEEDAMEDREMPQGRHRAELSSTAAQQPQHSHI